MIARIVLALSVTASMYLCALFTVNQAMLPVVHVSATSGECVRVVGDGSCDDLPEFYSRVWVQ